MKIRYLDYIRAVGIFHIMLRTKLCTWKIDGKKYLELLRTDKVYLIQSSLLVPNEDPEELCKKVKPWRPAELPETKDVGLFVQSEVLVLIDRVKACLLRKVDKGELYLAQEKRLKALEDKMKF